MVKPYKDSISEYVTHLTKDKSVYRELNTGKYFILVEKPYFRTPTRKELKKIKGKQKSLEDRCGKWKL